MKQHLAAIRSLCDPLRYRRAYSLQRVKQHLAAIRSLCDWLVAHRVLPTNAVPAVRGSTAPRTRRRCSRASIGRGG